MIDLNGRKIAVLMGGPGNERKVSLASGAGVATALRGLGADVTEVDVAGSELALPAGIEIAFNVIHGTFGEDGQVQRILEARGVKDRLIELNAQFTSTLLKVNTAFQLKLLSSGAGSGNGGGCSTTHPSPARLHLAWFASSFFCTC